MNSPLQCEFSLVRYVPDPVKNEFVNIGVLLREAGRPDPAAVRFTRDWGRVRCLDRDADTAMLEAMETDLRRRLAEAPPDSKPLLAVIEDSFSHLLQMTAPQALLAENLAAGMDQLMRLYVEPRKEKIRAALTGRTAIVRSLRSAFEQAGVWDLMRRRIAASDYTRPGDPLKIDCGYRPNGQIRMFHAAIVEPLRDGNHELTRAANASEEEYRFGVETMEAQQIRVLTVNDLDRVAARAKEELRV